MTYIKICDSDPSPDGVNQQKKRGARMMSAEEFSEKMTMLRQMTQYVSAATTIGQLVGSLVALLPWWLSLAPWWAVPIFMIVLGWLGGRVYGAIVYRRCAYFVKTFYPEVKL